MMSGSRADERWGWCPADDCPTSVCGAVHREVRTSLGIETVRDGQPTRGEPVSVFASAKETR